MIAFSSSDEYEMNSELVKYLQLALGIYGLGILIFAHGRCVFASSEGLNILIIINVPPIMKSPEVGKIS